MQQFLGNRGLISPITEIIPASDGMQMTVRLTNGASLLFVLADEINDATK